MNATTANMIRSLRTICPDENGYVTAKQLAAICGASTSNPVIARIQEGRIEAVKPLGIYLISRREAERVILEGEKEVTK